MTTKPVDPSAAAEPIHKAIPGKRRVFVCLKCRARVFLKDEPAAFVPSCHQHGPMVRQANHPYMGQSTEPSEEQGWPPAVDGVEKRDAALERHRSSAT